MLLSSTRILTAAALLFLAAGVSSAQGVKLEFLEGRVNLSAQNVPARVILAEWARLGGTTIVGGDRVAGGPMTVELMGVTEREALDVLLREVPGYMLAARQNAAAAGSRFDRIMIVPTTAVPRPAPAATFAPAPPPFAAQDDFAAAERAEQEAQRRAEELRVREEAARRALDTVRGVVTPAVTVQPGVPPPFGEPAAPQPVTPPPPTPFPGNPFMPTPGSATPGTIAPVVPQPQQPQNTPRPVQ